MSASREREFKFRVPIPDGSGQAIRCDHEETGREVAAQIAETRMRQTVWAQGEAGMVQLGRMFPTMVRFDGTTVPGVDPWEPEQLVRWLNTSGEPTSGSRQAAMFLLSVWNAEDWSLLGLKVRRLEKGSTRRRIGRFDFNDAWACWDAEHRAAALAWLTCPFWP